MYSEISPWHTSSPSLAASQKRLTKARIYKEVFGDLFEAPEYVRSKCRFVGENDIEILEPGGLTLTIGES